MKIRARDVAADQVVVIDGRNWLVQSAKKVLVYGDDTNRILLTLEKTGETRTLICLADDLIELLFPVGTDKTRAEDIRPGMTIVVEDAHWDVVSAISRVLTTLTVRKPGAKRPTVVVVWNDLLLDVVA